MNKLKLSAVVGMSVLSIMMLTACANSEDKKLSNTTVNTALAGKSEVVYDIVYIDQESSNESGGENYYSTDVIGYMNNNKDEQLRIALKNSLPSNDIKYQTRILTNPDDKPTLKITKKDDKTTIVVSRQPYQRYIQPNVEGTVTDKETNK